MLRLKVKEVNQACRRFSNGEPSLQSEAILASKTVVTTSRLLFSLYGLLTTTSRANFSLPDSPSRSSDDQKTLSKNHAIRALSLVEVTLALAILVFVISICLVTISAASTSSSEMKSDRAFADILDAIQSSSRNVPFDRLATMAGSRYYDINGSETTRQRAVFSSTTRITGSSALQGSQSLKTVTVELRTLETKEDPVRFSFLVADQGG